MKTSLRQLLREVRSRRRWSREQCAKAFGITPRALRSWENGERVPKPIVRNAVDWLAKQYLN